MSPPAPGVAIASGRCAVCGESAGVTMCTCRTCGRRVRLCALHARTNRCDRCQQQMPRRDLALRSRILEASGQGLASVLAEEAVRNPALVSGVEPETALDVAAGWRGVEPPEPEEDMTPELIEEVEDFSRDPEGDWSQTEGAQPAVEAIPDLIIREVRAQETVELEVEVPPPPVWTCDERLQGTVEYWRARMLLGFVGQRQERLAELGRLLVEREASFLKAQDPDAAHRALRPLTRKLVQRELRLRDDSEASRLVQGKLLRTPHLGIIPLDALFDTARGPRSRLGRPREIALWIRDLVTGAPDRRWTAEGLRRALEERRKIPTSSTKRERDSATRQIRRARQLAGPA